MEAFASATTRKRSATATGATTEASVRAAHRAKHADADNESEDDDKSETREVDAGGESTGDAYVRTGGVTTEEEGGEGDTDVEIIEDTDAYRATKAMGDVDRQVCLISVMRIHSN
jgi:hypothetical protein